MKRMISILLCAVLLTACLAGCSGTGAQDLSATATPEATAAATAEPTAAATRDWAAIRDKYPADTVVMTVDGEDVLWSEYFYWLYSTVSNVESYVGQTDDLTQTFPYGDGTQTYAEYYLDTAKSQSVQYHAINVNCQKAGAALTDADKQKIADDLKTAITNNCGDGATEDDFNTFLESKYIPRSLYDYSAQVAALLDDCFALLYGKNGANVSDEDVAAYISDNGYMTARHILLKITDDSGTALSDDEKAAKKAQAQDIADQLKAETDQTKRLALFDKLYAEYNEDSGEDDYPGGYCFASGSMDENFEKAAAALAEYEVSDVVESTYGYHVILRMPTTADDIVQYNADSDSYTLRYMAASDQFNTVINGWISDADVVWAKDFENLDISALLK